MQQTLVEQIEQRKDVLTNASDHIWDLAEMKFEEYESAETICTLLEEEGFTIERGVGGIPTAFIASYATGATEPIIGLLGEYDALSGMSQKAGVCKESPSSNGKNGHGCGHNLLGVGMAGAAIALRYTLEEEQIGGTIRYYGCPAEEGGSGKTYMVRAGLFDDVDVALTWHPGYDNGVSQGSTLANYQVSYQFKGKSSHAAISPHLGRSALDAIELMNVGMNYLREHIIPEARVHYAVTNTGGESPNVVQADAEVLYLIRAPLVKDVQHIYERLNDIAKGASLMTGTEVDIVFDKGCSNVVPNRSLYTLMHTVFDEIGVPTHTSEERAFAKQMAETINPHVTDDVLATNLNPLTVHERSGSASTDVGDVSWVVPTVQCETACFTKGTAFHSWQMVAQGKTSLGHKGMIHASKVVAATALHLFTHPGKIAEARNEWKERLAGKKYICPIPEHIHPPVK